MRNVAKSPDPMDETIRRNIVKFREETKLSQAQVADLSGVPMGNLSRYERGENAVPASVIPLLAQVFGRDPGDFYRRDPGPPPDDAELDVYFLRVRPGRDEDAAVAAEIRAAIARGNEKLRGRKHKK
jgi:transcriptional regulator with XRE-family HTH domain